MENFFETGEIMLSCFNKFRKYPDEMQGDKREGEASVAWFNGKGTKMVMYDAGLNAYIMSTTNEINDDVKNDFKATCAIKIKHPTLFALEVAKKLPYVNSGLEGDCDYSASRVRFLESQAKEIKEFDKLDIQDSEGQQEFKNLTLGMELFLKLDQYKHQQEYRFVWFSNDVVNDSIMVKCPEARTYCEMIYF